MGDNTISWNDELVTITDEELEIELRNGAKEHGYTYEEYIKVLDNHIFDPKAQEEFVAKLRSEK